MTFSLNLIADAVSQTFNTKTNSILDEYELLPTGNKNVFVIPQFRTIDILDPDVVREHQLQRDHKRRLHKMRKHFKKQLPSLYNFSIALIRSGFKGTINGETLEVSSGVDMLDGHTRRENWIQQIADDNWEGIPECVNVVVYVVDTFKDYKDIYYSFDSTDASEKTNEKIYGAMNALNVVVNSTTARSGSFGSALDIAYPGDRKDDILTKVAYFQKEIAWLDKIGLFNPADKDLKFQCMIAAGLMALKLYGEPEESRLRIEGGLVKLAQAKRDTASYDPEHWYGLDLIQYEYFNPGTKEWSVPDGCHRKTNFNSIAPQMDFLLFCLEMYMTKTKVKKNRGMKATMYKDIYKSTSDALLAIQPPCGYEVETMVE